MGYVDMTRGPDDNEWRLLVLRRSEPSERLVEWPAEQNEQGKAEREQKRAKRVVVK